MAIEGESLTAKEEEQTHVEIKTLENRSVTTYRIETIRIRTRLGGSRSKGSNLVGTALG